MNMNDEYKCTCLILGSNKGERFGMLQTATDLIASSAGIIISRSSVYETEPWGYEDTVDYLNQALLVDTLLSAKGLLSATKEIEIRLGRERTDRGYSARTMDIDILFYDNEIIQTDELIIPHPRLHERRFVLEPLNEIAPGMVHPALKLTVEEMLKQCKDPSSVRRIG